MTEWVSGGAITILMVHNPYTYILFKCSNHGIHGLNSWHNLLVACFVLVFLTETQREREWEIHKERSSVVELISSSLIHYIQQQVRQNYLKGLLTIHRRHLFRTMTHVEKWTSFMITDTRVSSHSLPQILSPVLPARHQVSISK